MKNCEVKRVSLLIIKSLIVSHSYQEDLVRSPITGGEQLLRFWYLSPRRLQRARKVPHHWLERVAEDYLMARSFFVALPLLDIMTIIASHVTKRTSDPYLQRTARFSDACGLGSA